MDNKTIHRIGHIGLLALWLGTARMLYRGVVGFSPFFVATLLVLSHMALLALLYQVEQRKPTSEGR